MDGSCALRDSVPMRMHALLLAPWIAAAFLGSPRAQVVYDDFLGSTIDAKLWTAFGAQSYASVSASRLRFALPADEEVVFTSQSAFAGDFDFVLDFSGFTVTGAAPSSYELTVLDAEGPPSKISELNFEISGSAAGRAYAVYATKNGAGHGSALRATTATGGLLRIVRSQGQVSAMFRDSSSLSWTTLRSWGNFLTNFIYVEIAAFTQSGGSLAVTSDKITYAGTRVSSPVLYGSGCNNLRARAWSIPYYGNASFGTIALGDAKLANAPGILLVGFTKVSADLTAAGAPGCTLYTTPDLLLLAQGLDQEAVGIATIPLPNDANLVGLRFYQQFTAITAQNALKIVFSNGVESLVRKP